MPFGQKQLECELPTATVTVLKIPVFLRTDMQVEKEADASPSPLPTHRRSQLSPQRRDHSFRAAVLKEWSTAQQHEDHLGTGQPCKMPGPQPRSAESVILISALECASLESENHCVGEQKPSSTACTHSGAVRHVQVPGCHLSVGKEAGRTSQAMPGSPHLSTPGSLWEEWPGKTAGILGIAG